MFKTTDFYVKCIEKNLSLADQLASIRSILANERTFLSYQRTALTLAVAGFTFIKFFNVFWIVAIGWIFLPCALITMSFGIYRYIRMRNLIQRLEIHSMMNNDGEPDDKAK